MKGEGRKWERGRGKKEWKMRVRNGGKKDEI